MEGCVVSYRLKGHRDVRTNLYGKTLIHINDPLSWNSMDEGTKGHSRKNRINQQKKLNVTQALPHCNAAISGNTRRRQNKYMLVHSWYCLPCVQ